MTAEQLIKAALRSIGIGSVENPTNDEVQDGLEDLQIMLRSWSAQGQMIYFTEQTNQTLSAGTASYTIGSGGTFNVTRPTRITSAFIRSDTDLEVKMIDERTYAQVSDKTSTGTPAYCWYNPEYPLGIINLYPTPDGNDDFHFWTQNPLTSPTAISSSVSFPPEYDEAIRWNLAVRMAPNYGKVLPAEVVQLAVASKNSIEKLNAAQQASMVKLEMFQLSRHWDINQG